VDLSSFIPLAQPESVSFIGQAWDLSGAPDADCYQSSTVPDSPSYDTIRYTWHRSIRDTIGLAFTKVIGLGVLASATDSGQLEFSKVSIRRVSAPVASSFCSAKGKDELPLRPAVEALVGAVGYSYKAFAGRQLQAGANLDTAIKKVADAKVDHANDGSVVVSFSSLRWFGATLKGFDRVMVGDTIRTGIQQYRPQSVSVPLGGTGWTTRVSATDAQDTLFRIVFSNGADLRADTAFKHHGDNITFGRPRSGGATGGTYFTGLFVALPAAVRQEYQMFIVQMGNAEHRFFGPHGADSVRAWVARRRLGG
jgi:hypothetical protein